MQQSTVGDLILVDGDGRTVEAPHRGEIVRAVIGAGMAETVAALRSADDTHFTEGGKSAAELAEAVAEAADEPTEFAFLYPDEGSCGRRSAQITVGLRRLWRGVRP